MSLIFMDGMYYPTNDLLFKYSGLARSNIVDISATTRRVGPGSIRVQTGGSYSSYITYSPPIPLVGTTFGCALMITGTPTESFDRKLISLGGCDVFVETNSNFSMTLRAGGATITSDPAIFNSSVWFYLELQYTKSATTATVTLRINEAIKAQLTGLNINNDCTSVKLEADYGGPYHYFQDLYICDGLGATNNDFLGDVKVDIMRPDSAGTYTDFTPNVDTNYENVDEEDCDEDATYNESAVVGDKDTYNLSAISLTGQEIFGTQQCSVIRKTDASLRYGKQLLISDTTEDLSDEIQFNDTYTGYQRCFDTDPDTATTWTESGVNALESGLTVTQ